MACLCFALLCTHLHRAPSVTFCPNTPLGSFYVWVCWWALGKAWSHITQYGFEHLSSASPSTWTEMNPSSLHSWPEGQLKAFCLLECSTLWPPLDPQSRVANPHSSGPTVVAPPFPTDFVTGPQGLQTTYLTFHPPSTHSQITPTTSF